MRSRIVAESLLLVVVALGASARANAEPTADEKAQAEVLFQDGKRLMTQKHYDEACPKLAESQRLDPAGGTLLNLAVCHEAEGKTATAWVEFEDALNEAKSDRRPERIKLAKDHIDHLELKLARLIISVPPGMRVPGLAVVRDGNPIHEAAFGTPIPVDPGDHKIVATAKGWKTWETEVTVSPGEKREVIVPALDLDPSAQPALAASAAPSSEPPPAENSMRKTAGFLTLGGGGVALIVGTIFGAKTLSRKSASDDHCPSATTCDAAGVTANDDAHRDAWVSDIGFGIGLAAVGVGTYLLLSNGDPAPSTGLHLAPNLGKSSGGLTLGGTL